MLTDAASTVNYGAHDRAVLVSALGGSDRVTGTSFNDRLDGGAGHDQLFGGDGADTLIGGAGTDGLRGDEGDDVLDGGAGTDELRGGAGDDILNGGLGGDRLAGGEGRDVFVFDALGLANRDRIEDFDAQDDVIRLDSSVFVGLQTGPLFASAFAAGHQAIDASDHILYNDATGDLLFDVDGVGGAAAIKFATVDPGTWLTADDFLVF